MLVSSQLVVARFEIQWVSRHTQMIYASPESQSQHEHTCTTADWHKLMALLQYLLLYEARFQTWKVLWLFSEHTLIPRHWPTCAIIVRWVCMFLKIHKYFSSQEFSTSTFTQNFPICRCIVSSLDSQVVTQCRWRSPSCISCHKLYYSPSTRRRKGGHRHQLCWGQTLPAPHQTGWGQSASILEPVSISFLHMPCGQEHMHPNLKGPVSNNMIQCHFQHLSINGTYYITLSYYCWQRQSK